MNSALRTRHIDNRVITEGQTLCAQLLAVHADQPVTFEVQQGPGSVDLHGEYTFTPQDVGISDVKVCVRAGQEHSYINFQVRTEQARPEIKPVKDLVTMVNLETATRIQGSHPVCGVEYSIVSGPGKIDSRGNYNYTPRKPGRELVCVRVTRSGGTAYRDIKFSVIATTAIPAIKLFGSKTIQVGEKFKLVLDKLNISTNIFQIRVDWGDGSHNLYSSQGAAYHVYDSGAIGSRVITVEFTDKMGVHKFAGAYQTTVVNRTRAFGGHSQVKDGYQYHLFTENGVFDVVTLNPDTVFEYLVVAGGGAGADGKPGVAGAGGGAGGFVTGECKLERRSYPVQVGQGGQRDGAHGKMSVFCGVTAWGGSGGCHGDKPKVGGSGGGGTSENRIAGQGAGQQGKHGGVGHNDGVYDYAGGGGGRGGAGQPGSQTPPSGGYGGAGRQWLNGLVYAGGGGGGTDNHRAEPAYGQAGGGTGGRCAPGQPARPHTGSGGGGGAPGFPGGAGSDGIVIIRYPIHKKS